MSYFTKDYNKFFKELAANNNKEWFDQNRKRYEKSVKEPFKAFVQELIDQMAKIDPAVQIQPKDAIFRINRDIRFSKDKTPYKTNLSAIIGPKGKKDKTYPGMYVEMGPADVRIYGGVYMLERDQLQNIRETIANDLKGFDKVISGKEFKEKYGEIHGEKMKRLPKELMEAAEKQPLIFNKNFYFFAKFKPSLSTDPKLVDTLMEYYKIGRPVGEYLFKAIGK